MGGLERILILAPALAALACGSPDGTTSAVGDTYPTPPAPKPLEWSACTEPELADTECATLEVPLDYAHPDEETIQIAVSRIRASDPGRRIGPLMMSPDGPGLPGRPEAPAARRVLTNFPELLERFDMIGFDPRGVGASAAIDCGDVRSYRSVDWTPDDTAEQQALERTMREFVAACEEGTGALLPFLDSYSAARDIDQLRKALGAETISYWAIGYGTVIGEAYAELFPERLRASVLEYPVRPHLDGAAFVREQAEAREQAFDSFAADCDARPECAVRFGGDLRGAFDRAVDQLAITPLVDPASGETMNKSVLAWIVSVLLPGLPENHALIESLIADVGTSGSFVSGWLQQVQDEAERAVAIDCLDLGFPEPTEVFTRLMPELRASAPRFGHASLNVFLPCAYWPVEPRTPPAHASGAPPILVIGGTGGDPTKPYWWAQRLAADLDSAVLLTREGDGWGPENECVDGAMNSYLLDRVMPAIGTVCPGP